MKGGTLGKEYRRISGFLGDISIKGSIDVYAKMTRCYVTSREKEGSNPPWVVGENESF